MSGSGSGSAPAVVQVTKNDFFTYFKVGDTEIKYREREQIWNCDGISMKIQGDLPGGGYNSFGKKHLLSIAGGKSTTALDKAKKVLDKRKPGTNINAKRSKKETTITNTLAPKPSNMKEESVRNQYKTDLGKAKGEAGKHFEKEAYGGTRTEICTFVLLDDLGSLKAAAEPFALAIKAVSDWSKDAEVEVYFSKHCVLTVDKAGTVDYADGISVSVKKDGGTYHIYHCNGALESAPDLGVLLS